MQQLAEINPFTAAAFDMVGPSKYRLPSDAQNPIVRVDKALTQRRSAAARNEIRRLGYPWPGFDARNRRKKCRRRH